MKFEIGMMEGRCEDSGTACCFPQREGLQWKAHRAANQKILKKTNVGNNG
jgi:hypothetical protein